MLPKKKIHKAAKTTRDFLRNKITWEFKNIKKRIIPPKIREEIFNKLKEALSKWSIKKYLICQTIQLYWSLRQWNGLKLTIYQANNIPWTRILMLRSDLCDYSDGIFFWREG